MRKLSYQEIFARRPTLAQIAHIPRNPIYCLLENVRSLYNVGSIFRTSDAVRLNKLYLTGYTGSPPRKEIDKTALGATDAVDWEYVKNPLQVITELKKERVSIVALEHTSASKNYYEFEFTFPFCLLLGNEVDGLSEELITTTDAAVEIPMYGLKQSLNVSVAYGIVIYHALGQYLNGSRNVNDDTYPAP
jgi:tRNA G18 (ribose-2'-O)-methylase SpoU